MTTNVPLANPRHELFCKNISIGMNATDALAAAGFQRSAELAQRLMERPEIILRIQAITQLHRNELEAQRREMERSNEASDLGVTQEWVIKHLKTNVLDAQDAGQYGAAHSTLKTLGIIVGLFDDDTRKKEREKLPEMFSPKQLENFSNLLANADIFDEDLPADAPASTEDDAGMADASDLPEDDSFGAFQLDPLDAADELQAAENIAAVDAYADDPADIPHLAQ